MKKILPVKIDAIITSECWTYWKMAIIQTLPDYMIWLSSHLDIFQNLDSVYFGKDLKVFSNEYYSDILDIEEIKIYSISYNKIIEFIKNCINSDFYYTVFILKNLNNECNNLHILHDSNNIFHEIFIYGYDDENKVFNSISISENNYFKPTTIAYDKLKNGYLTMQKYFYYNPSQYNFKRDFSYLISRSKVNYKYKTKEYY